ncbi:hypothetical protein PWT90_09454 [Aphanocladium album]|nr:hypothetical protein PWT90_09454 [Aphanocladium album]
MLLHRLHQHFLLHAQIFHNLLFHKRLELVRDDGLVHVVPLHRPVPEPVPVGRNLLRQLAHRLRDFFLGEAAVPGAAATRAAARVVLDGDELPARARLLLLVVEQALHLGNGAALRAAAGCLRLLRGSAERQLERLRRGGGSSSSRSSRGFAVATIRLLGLLVQEGIRHAPRALQLRLLAALVVLFLPPVRLVLGLLVGAVHGALARPRRAVAVVRVRLAAALALVVPFLVVRQAVLHAALLGLGAVLLAVMLALQRRLPRPLAVRPLALRLAVQLVRLGLVLAQASSVELLVAGIGIVVAVRDAAVLHAAADKGGPIGSVLCSGAGGCAARAQRRAVGTVVRHGTRSTVASPLLLFEFLLAT